MKYCWSCNNGEVFVISLAASFYVTLPSWEIEASSTSICATSLVNYLQQTGNIVILYIIVEQKTH